ncbi:Tim44 domain-containing protein [Geminicoccus roseus]|uniref:Tim44 domain-containing protein n=1 Tax=Geminicoccus roseus TaxID=404900 RepID=UPI00041847E5|nr:TIM44-like domain-containing protein [Geminicoccus roseus]
MTKSKRSTGQRIRVFAAMALAVVMVLASTVAEARRGGSFGSRGARTYSQPMATPTAPNKAAPMQQSVTPAQRPATAGTAASGQRGGFFSRGGFMPGLMGGLIGAGLFGMLFGGGFFAGLGSFAGILGFLLQIVLVVVLVRFALAFFRSRTAPAYAGGAGGAGGAGPRPRSAPGGAAPRPNRARVRDEIGVAPGDYTAFENGLRTVQTAYGQEDLVALQAAVTPEMYGYFIEELEANRARGRQNLLSDIRLVQGDLAEAWREGSTEYATVAMRYAMKDYTVERASGSVVEGDPAQPVEVTELWTFTRPVGGAWILSAIQQAG